MPRRIISLVALAAATFVLALRIHQLNQPRGPRLAPRTLHLLYLDSLRHELLTFAEQYGRPVFQYDTTSPVTGHGRIQLARLREALFDPRVEYGFSDEGFSIEWRSDPKPRYAARVQFVRTSGSDGGPRLPIASLWPATAAEYARIRRLVITPQWPEPQPRRANRGRPPHVPPLWDALFLSAPATSH